MAEDIDVKVVTVISAAVSAWLRQCGADASRWRVGEVRRVDAGEIGDE